MNSFFYINILYDHQKRSLPIGYRPTLNILLDFSYLTFIKHCMFCQFCLSVPLSVSVYTLLSFNFKILAIVLI